MFGVAKPGFDGPSGFVEASTFAEGKGLAEAGGDVMNFSITVSDSENAKCQGTSGIIWYFHRDDAVGLFTGLKLLYYFPCLWHGDDEVFSIVDEISKIMV